MDFLGQNLPKEIFISYIIAEKLARLQSHIASLKKHRTHAHRKFQQNGFPPAHALIFSALNLFAWEIKTNARYYISFKSWYNTVGLDAISNYCIDNISQANKLSVV